MSEERARFRRAMEHAAASEPDSELARQHKLAQLGERVLEILKEHEGKRPIPGMPIALAVKLRIEGVVRSLGLLDGGERP